MTTPASCSICQSIVSSPLPTYGIVVKPTQRLLLVSLILSWCLLNNFATARNERTFSNEWAVEIQGGNVVADEVASLHGFVNHGKILRDENYYLFSHPKVVKRSLNTHNHHHNNLITNQNVNWAEQQRIKRRAKRDLTFNPQESPNDPKWTQMWYLVPSTQPSMRVVDAWQAGFTGRNVSVTILDDGIEHSHPDLHANYDPEASSDINGHDSDPTPRLNPSNENRHGTRCAGEVAAVANNNICSVGIAYNAKIGGVRMLDGSVTDAVEAASIGLRPEHIDIYSASWGPDDDGRTVDGPAKLARKAFVNGVTNGRNGRGSIFVWASGNGGRRQDNCNCDGYTDSIYTLSISSTTQRGTKPWYSESCSSTLAATYSSGSSEDHQIITTDLRHGCTTTHTGTSASAPLAAGICALALEANPNLTWRDMQHLVVQTARPDKLHVDDWVVNGANRKVSHAFGYGLMDAYGMVKKAQNWTLVPSQRICTKSVISPSQTPRMLSYSSPIIVPVEMVSCDDGVDMIDRLEHVQAQLTVHNERRGDLVIYLTSPMGTKSQLLGQRRQDLTSQGFTEWSFMTTHSWDEDPRGRWTLEIRDRNQRAVSGSLSLFNLVLYGTTHSDWPEDARLTPPPETTTTTSASTTTSTNPEPPVTTITKHIQKTASSVATETTTMKTTTEGNCKIAMTSGTGCLACHTPTPLDPTSNKCVKSCAVGHYEALEHVNEKGERKDPVKPRDSEIGWEEVQDEVYEDEERFYNGYVCRPCAELCHSCIGPLTTDCVQCVSGAQLRKDFACVSTGSSGMAGTPKSELHTKQLYYLSIVVVVLAVAIFVGLFVACQNRNNKMSRCFGRNSGNYSYLPSGDGALTRIYSDDYNVEYRDDDPTDSPQTKVVPNSIPNGVAQRNGYVNHHQSNGYAPSTTESSVPLFAAEDEADYDVSKSSPVQ